MAAPWLEPMPPEVGARTFEEFVEQGRLAIVTAAASAHVRTALGDKAFDGDPSRGLALTLGDAVAYAENQAREALAAIKETGRSEP